MIDEYEFYSALPSGETSLSGTERNTSYPMEQLIWRGHSVQDWRGVRRAARGGDGNEQ